MVSPHEKANRKLKLQLSNQKRQKLYTEVLNQLKSDDLKISKAQLLGDDSKTSGTKVSYYSRVAEVNAQGELSGDETTQSTNSNSEDEDGSLGTQSTVAMKEI